jgi:hypothetical protein
MRRSRLDDATLIDDGGPRYRSRRPRRGWFSRLVPGVWASLAALGVLCLLVLLAPQESAAARASLLGLAISPLVLLTVAAALGALASLSGIRHLWAGDAPLRGTLGLALGACPVWLSASLLLLRFVGSIS